MNNIKHKACIVCGRKIIDENNKTGLCPKHEKKGTNILASIGAFGISLLVKKYGGKIAKGAVNLIVKR